MKVDYICDYLYNSGYICGKACTRSEGCRLHYKARKRLPCSELGCNKPTGSNSGRCQQHIRGYYQIQYVNRLRNRAMEANILELGNQIAQENLNHPLIFEQLMNRHRNRLIELNISLCREYLIPIGIEEGEHCNKCVSS